MTGRQRRTSLTPEERHQRSVSARRKFRAIVHLIINNLSWLQEIEDDKLGDNVRKNIRVLTRKKGKKSLLTLQDKSLLNKPVEDRTPEEMEHLRHTLGRFKCFRRFSKHVRDQMPHISHFCFYGPNRVIMKQNYEPINMYVLLSGEVVISQTFYDRLLKEEVNKDMMVLGGGTFFGEVALIHGTNRLATVTTSQPCEMLYIKREDFDRVLKEELSRMWYEIIADLSCFTYFRNWNEYDIRDLCIVSRKNSYQPDQLVLSSTGGHHDCVYFITKGACYLLEHLKVQTEYKNGRNYYHLMADNAPDHEEEMKSKTRTLRKLYKRQDSDQSAMRLRPVLSGSVPTLQSSAVTFATKHYFMRVCTLGRLACFNVGENLKHRMVVAEAETECLLIPRYFLYEKSLSTFQTVAEYLRNTIPSTKKVFEVFMEEKKWISYKERVVDEVVGGKMPVNSLHNVPYSVRLMRNLD